MVDFTNKNPGNRPSTKLSLPNWTEEQQAVLDCTEDTVLVNAYAGSGKSALLLGIADAHNGKGLYLAFNKSIVKDIGGKLPENFDCKTFHSLGLQLCFQNLAVKPKVNFNKVYSMATGFSGSAFILKSLVEKHMATNRSNKSSAWEKTCRECSVSSYNISNAKKLFKAAMADKNIISGDEMLAWPLESGWETKPYDVVLVDETNDLSPQQLDFLFLIPTKRLIFVGDIYQQIYGFRAADPKVFSKIKKVHTPAQFEVTESFRCPQNILKEVHKYVPGIRSSIPGGSVLHEDFDAAPVLANEFIAVCRSNSGLIRMANILLKQGEDFYISKAFSNTMQAVYKKITADNPGMTIRMARANTNSIQQSTITYAKKQGWATEAIRDKYEAFMTILDMVDTMKEVLPFLRKLGSNSDLSSTKRLLTIHAAKGLEHENIYFVHPHIIDSIINHPDSTKASRQQERNLFYVACTRSLKNLTYIS